jgi:hypothetical protein
MHFQKDKASYNTFIWLCHITAYKRLYSKYKGCITPIHVGLKVYTYNPI